MLLRWFGSRVSAPLRRLLREDTALVRGGSRPWLEEFRRAIAASKRFDDLRIDSAARNLSNRVAGAARQVFDECYASDARSSGADSANVRDL